MRSVISLLVTGSVVAACGGPRGGTDVGNGATATFDLGKYRKTTEASNTSNNNASRKSESDPLVTAGDIRVEEFWVAISDIKTEIGACGAKPSKAAIHGPLVGDLVQEDPLAEASDELALSGTEQCRVRLKLSPVEAGDLPSGAPEELVGASLLIRGQRADGTPFIVRSERGETINLDTEGEGLTLQGDNALVVAFDIEGAVTSLDLDSLEPEVGDGEVDAGTIYVDSKHNMSKLSQVESSVRRDLGLFFDSDQNGVFTGEETNPARVLATPSEDGE